MKKTIRLFSVILAFILVSLSALSVQALEGITVNDNLPDNLTRITVHYDSKKTPRTLQVPYSDDLFKMPSYKYSHVLAQASMGLAVSAFRDVIHTETPDDNFIEFAKNMGMEDIVTTPYASEPTTDSICYGIASKKIDDFTLITIGVCGQSYGKEWASNLTIGTDIRSQGFNEAAQQIERGVYEYITRHNINAPTKIWICGFSRAAAASNIAAADFTSSGYFSDVYAYCFACPRTTTKPGNYNNIYNIMSKDDIVPKLPFPDWGYKRYGHDLYFKSAESDSDSEAFTKRSAEVYYDLTQSPMPINHDVNSELRTVFDYLLALFPDPEAYVKDMQSMVRGIFNGAEGADLITNFISLLTEYSEKNEASAYEISELIEYVQLLANKYLLSGNTAQKESGAWNLDLGTLNFFNEHLPDKYVSRIYAFDDPEKIFSDYSEYCRLIIFGEQLNVTIQNNGNLALSIAPDGNQTGMGEISIYSVPYVSYKKNSIELMLPKDSNWTIYLNSAQNQTISYIGMLLSENSVKSITDNTYVLNMKSNIMYQIVLDSGNQIVNKELSNYNQIIPIENGYYSPSLVMRLENYGLEGITITDIVTVVIILSVFLAVEIILSLIFLVTRKIRKRRRSAIITIIASLINIVIFAFFEHAAWYFVPEFPIARTIIRVIIFLVLFGFTLRSYRRYKAREWIHVVFISLAISVVDIFMEYKFARRCEGFFEFLPLIIYAALFISACIMWRQTYKKYEKFYLPPEERSLMDSQL